MFEDTVFCLDSGMENNSEGRSTEQSEEPHFWGANLVNSGEGKAVCLDYG